MTLGPGTLGGSSTSDNISALHLINIKRLAYEIRPYRGSERATVKLPDGKFPVVTQKPVEQKAETAPAAAPLSAEDVRAIVEEFLGARQLTGRGT